MDNRLALHRRHWKRKKCTADIVDCCSLKRCRFLDSGWSRRSNWRVGQECWRRNRSGSRPSWRWPGQSEYWTPHWTDFFSCRKCRWYRWRSCRREWAWSRPLGSARCTCSKWKLLWSSSRNSAGRTKSSAARTAIPPLKFLPFKNYYYIVIMKAGRMKIPPLSQLY